LNPLLKTLPVLFVNLPEPNWMFVLAKDLLLGNRERSVSKS
jgi:hypothetical protein